MDSYDRIWDADQSFSPFHLSTGFNIQLSFNLSSIEESPPLAVLQTARVLARRDALAYYFPLDKLGDYYIVLYFAGILPVSPTFDVLINGDVVWSSYTVKNSEATALFFTRKGIKSLSITLKNISFNPLINAIEVYEMVDIPSETSSTTGNVLYAFCILNEAFLKAKINPILHLACWYLLAVSALQVIQQSTGLDLGWQDDPCSPTPWDHIGCHGSLVTSLYVQVLKPFPFPFSSLQAELIWGYGLILGGFPTLTWGQSVLHLVTYWILEHCKLFIWTTT